MNKAATLLIRLLDYCLLFGLVAASIAIGLHFSSTNILDFSGFGVKGENADSVDENRKDFVLKKSDR